MSSFANNQQIIFNMLCSVTLLLLICATAQAFECGPCNCYTGDGDAGGSIKWENLTVSECKTNNTITSVPDISVLPEDIQVINIEDQNIPTIKQNQFIDFTELQIINIDNSNISVVESNAFRNKTNVIAISLYKNLISTLPTDLFIDTPNVKYIYLGRNKLKVLQENLFHNLEQLEEVVIFGNEITTIERNSFVNTPRLHFLNLGNNKLSSLNWNIVSQLPSLKDLYLEENPWNCNTTLCEVMSSFIYSPSWENVDEDLTCASPPEVEGKDWRTAVATMCNSTSEPQDEE